MTANLLGKLTTDRLQSVLQAAALSPRKRANFNLHGPDDTLQRMVNAMLRGTYCRPHKHEAPDKLEIFTALKGSAAILRFDDQGEIVEAVRIDAAGPVFQVEIPPRTWHTVMALSPEAVLYEIIEGQYDPQTHKKFAAFAPPEGSDEAPAYLESLMRKVEARLSGANE